MSLKDRIRKLEQLQSPTEQRILLLTPCDKPEPTPEQIDAFKAKLDWTKQSSQCLAWTGDRFVLTLSEWLKARGHEVDNFDPERDIELCVLKRGERNE